MERPAKKFPPELLVCGTFLGLIALGALALRLPTVHHAAGLSTMDALFTATSAACVTGLTVVPTSGFNQAGQLTILALIQLGGLGIMALTASCILFFRGELDLRQRTLAVSLTEIPSMRQAEGVIATILIYTLLVETLGALVLSAGFRAEGFNTGESLYLGVFHAVSAFCNAGFSPFDQSLTGAGPLVKCTIMVLIVLGGLGYFVVHDLVEWGRRRDRLSIHTRAVLVGTLFFVAGGALLLGGLEGGALSALDALFQSVTARTAGFNTVELAALRPAGILILLLLMIVGAAPGSTGGGIKLTAFVAMAAAVLATLRGNRRTVLWGRSIPADNVLRAFATAAVYLALIVFLTVLLLSFETHPFLPAVFEVCSAVGTVGLSLDFTNTTGFAGRLILIAAMYCGRVGPVVLALLLVRGRERRGVDYPEERLLLG